MQQWEYRTILRRTIDHVGHVLTLEELQDLGRDGWEFAGMEIVEGLHGTPVHRYIFKRPVE